MGNGVPVDGSEILRSSWGDSSLSHYLQSFTDVSLYTSQALIPGFPNHQQYHTFAVFGNETSHVTFDPLKMWFKSWPLNLVSQRVWSIIWSGIQKFVDLVLQVKTACSCKPAFSNGNTTFHLPTMKCSGFAYPKKCKSILEKGMRMRPNVENKSYSNKINSTNWVV